MKVVRELSNNVECSVLEDIYERGNKIAISFKKVTNLSDLVTEVMEAGGSKSDVPDVTLKKGLCANDGMIASDGSGELILIDRIVFREGFVEYRPFTGKFEEGVSTFVLRDEETGEIADSVYEVSLN